MKQASKAFYDRHKRKTKASKEADDSTRSAKQQREDIYQMLDCATLAIQDNLKQTQLASEETRKSRKEMEEIRLCLIVAAIVSSILLYFLINAVEKSNELLEKDHTNRDKQLLVEKLNNRNQRHEPKKH